MSWVGHSTVVIDLPRTRVITDPILRNRVAHLKRVSAPAITPENIDVILISHAHRDHLDLPTLRRLPRSAVIVVPAGLGKLVAPLRFAGVEEVIAGDVLDVAGAHVEVTVAVHPPGRGAIRRGAKPVAYVVGDDATVFFAGDTDLCDDFAELRGNVDVALLPISGWGPSLPAGHLSPVSAARLLHVLEPQACVPIHWGTLRPFYRGSSYPADAEAPGRFLLFASALAPDVDVRVLAPGERWSYG